MKKIDRHISKLFFKFFSLSLLAFLNIFLISQIFRVIKFITEEKMTVESSIVYFITLIPRTLIDVAPLSVLLGGLISMNVMASNLEIISLKTSGISFKRIIIFPIVISFIVSLSVYVISDRIAPKSYEQARILRGSDEKDRELPEEKENAFLRTNKNHIYYAKMMNRVTNEAVDLEIIEMNDDFTKIERITIAKEATFIVEEDAWVLNSVEIINVLTGVNESHERYVAKEYNEPPKKFMVIGRDPRTLTNRELKKEIRELRKVGKDIKIFIQELAQRYSYPFAAFVVSFIGLALGSHYVRGGSARNIGISIGLGYGYYLISGVFEAISKNGFINPFLSGWIPNILFLGLGIYYVRKAEY